MRTNRLVPALVIATLLCCPAAWSSDTVPAGQTVRASERFGRGLANIITAPLELPAQMYLRASYQHEYNPNPFATVGGFLEGIPMGIIYCGWRLAAGFVDLATFPFTRYDQGIIQPEYVTFSYQMLLDD
jgi:putative exosortase-associated protein (TIGR04073 family)